MTGKLGQETRTKFGVKTFYLYKSKYSGVCHQDTCHTCEPGYVKVVVDLKEFSKKFAAEIRLCTLCEHGLCPGSSLVVLFRCRELGYDECEVCANRVDKMGGEWCMCCQCEDTNRGLVNGSVGAGMIAPASGSASGRTPSRKPNSRDPR